MLHSVVQIYGEQETSRLELWIRFGVFIDGSLRDLAPRFLRVGLGLGFTILCDVSISRLDLLLVVWRKVNCHSLLLHN